MVYRRNKNKGMERKKRWTLVNVMIINSTGPPFNNSTFYSTYPPQSSTSTSTWSGFNRIFKSRVNCSNKSFSVNI